MVQRLKPDLLACFCTSRIAFLTRSFSRRKAEATAPEPTDRAIRPRGTALYAREPASSPQAFSSKKLIMRLRNASAIDGSLVNSA